MMGKSHRHDKHRCPRGSLQGRHEAPEYAGIPRNGVWPICSRPAARYGGSRKGRLSLKSNQEELRMSKDGLCAIVTGSASGLGAATAVILAKGGARIVVNYSSSQKEAEATADLCRSAGGEVVVVQGDVSRDEDCRKIVAAAAPWGRLDALVNNAGTTKHVAHEDLDGLSAEDFQRLFGVNTIGPFQMVRAARSLLEAAAKASGRASAVVNVSSVAGISGIGSSIAYAASKGALNTITHSLARALAPLIRVNTVCPGYIDTPWFTKGRGVEGAAKVRDSVVSRVPLKRASTAEDIANLVCFLATPPSSNMTGEVVRMDAGMHLIT
jgi:NAD(P)-dependent dehydrogenase (short-subunit alcohol dehydrogenase family)